MRIILEEVNSDDIEVTIKGNLASDEILYLITLLKTNKITSKIILLNNNVEIIEDIQNIIYFEVCNRKTYAITINGRYVCRYSLNEIYTLFKTRGIQQISKSILVNIHHVKSLEAEFSGNYLVTLVGDYHLIISRFYMKDFRKVIMEV